MKPVLCIRNDRYDTLGITAGALAAGDAEMRRLDAFSPEARWPEPEEISGLIVFGGEMNVDETEQHPYLMQEKELMQRALATGTPVLGICLGAQMLARVLGARVNRAPRRELGFAAVRLTAAGERDPVLGSMEKNPCVFEWHQDSFELPAGATLLATGDAVTNQAFSYGSNAWGTQFHFEVDRAGVEEWLRVSGDELERVWGKSAAQLREEMAMHLERQQGQAREIFRAFCRLASR
jgi:GMP synthase-like glutamine amidotransferase